MVIDRPSAPQPLEGLHQTFGTAAPGGPCAAGLCPRRSNHRKGSGRGDGRVVGGGSVGLRPCPTIRHLSCSRSQPRKASERAHFERRRQAARDRYGMKLTMPIAHSPTAVADNLRFRLVRGSKTDCSSLLGDRYVKGPGSGSRMLRSASWRGVSAICSSWSSHMNRRLLVIRARIVKSQVS